LQKLPIRSDSDRSSIRGSIVEEEYESCEVSSGERTPTEESGDEKHWNNRVKEPERTIRSARNDEVAKENRGGRLSGRITVDRSRWEPTTATAEPAPLTTRTARSTRGILNRNEPRKPYRPPAMRAAERNDSAAGQQASGGGGGGGGEVVRNSFSEEMPATTPSSSQPRQMTDYPVYHEIANKEGPRMQKVCVHK
uniref:ATX2 n=1 Tax=Heligmosomoides polygyrus TaxID=6339 RepID=A0A183F3W8_HELPZ